MATTVITKSSLKVSGAISASTSGTATLCTANANSYIIANLWLPVLTSIPANLTVQVANKTALQITAGAVVRGSLSNTTIYLGPGDSIAVTTNTGAVLVEISGLEFINT